jgi:hypothetical protein
MILECYLEISDTDKGQRLYLFMDEIQAVEGWDSWARKISDQRKDIRLILTGSSSKLLSKEISTQLRGRAINQELFPLSFKEMLAWEGVPYSLRTIAHSKDRVAVKRAFARFLKEGGYPALLMDRSLPREQILQSYYDSMIFKDIVERHRIENVNKLKSLAMLLFQSVCSELSYSSLANKMKAAGLDMSKSTVIEYISHFEDVYLFFQNLKYEYSVAKQLGSIKKVYCIDNGLLNAVSFKFSEDIGRLLENAVYVELRRRGEQVYRHKAKHDCDFLVMRKHQVTSAIQVTQRLDESTEKREIDGLMEAMQTHGSAEGLILTEDQETERIASGRKILVKPVWKWLLE